MYNRKFAYFRIVCLYAIYTELIVVYFIYVFYFIILFIILLFYLRYETSKKSEKDSENWFSNPSHLGTFYPYSSNLL